MSRTVLAAFLAASWAAASVSAQDMGTTPPPAPEPSPSASASSSSSASSNKASEPFYRKYLVPGNRLDEQILEQEKRIAETPSDASLHNDFGNLLAKRRFSKEAAAHRLRGCTGQALPSTGIRW